jgi:type IV secretory pathway VirB2 component (pilin)
VDRPARSFSLLLGHAAFRGESSSPPCERSAPFTGRFGMMQTLAHMVWLGPIATIVVLVRIVVTRFSCSKGWSGVFQLLTLVGGMLLMGVIAVCLLR